MECSENLEVYYVHSDPVGPASYVCMYLNNEHHYWFMTELILFWEIKREFLSFWDYYMIMLSLFTFSATL